MKPSHHRIVPNWLLLICAIVLVSALGYLTWWTCNQKDETATTIPVTSTNVNSNSNTNSAATAGWKTYTNDTYGFSFKYPEDDVANGDKSDSDSNVIIRTSDEYWLYTITVAPNTANQTLAQVAKQNFDKLSASITSYMTSEAGTTPTFAQSDLNIGGTPAKKMITTNKTGYSPSAEVVLIKNSNIITISPRAESDDFDTILSTFTFTK